MKQHVAFVRCFSHSRWQQHQFRARHKSTLLPFHSRPPLATSTTCYSRGRFRCQGRIERSGYAREKIGACYALIISLNDSPPWSSMKHPPFSQTRKDLTRIQSVPEIHSIERRQIPKCPSSLTQLNAREWHHAVNMAWNIPSLHAVKTHHAHPACQKQRRPQ